MRLVRAGIAIGKRMLSRRRKSVTGVACRRACGLNMTLFAARATSATGEIHTVTGLATGDCVPVFQGLEPRYMARRYVCLMRIAVTIVACCGGSRRFHHGAVIEALFRAIDSVTT